MVWMQFGCIQTKLLFIYVNLKQTNNVVDIFIENIYFEKNELMNK